MLLHFFFLKKTSKEFSFWVTLSKNKPTFVSAKHGLFSPQSSALTLWEDQDLSSPILCTSRDKLEISRTHTVSCNGGGEKRRCSGGILEWRLLMCISLCISVILSSLLCHLHGLMGWGRPLWKVVQIVIEWLCQTIMEVVWVLRAPAWFSPFTREGN